MARLLWVLVIGAALLVTSSASAQRGGSGKGKGKNRDGFGRGNDRAATCKALAVSAAATRAIQAAIRPASAEVAADKTAA